ncbi:LysE family translocator [Paenibacillus sp. P26]|nr:LysE family translocator [Paenibacillus sp. P26]UUZ95540.1 LysE family translocator [Paenibacillus sp. P25]
MNVLISYLILGLSLSAPIGPINAAQLDTGIKKGFMHAWFVGIGAMIADILYMLLVYMGLVHFISTPFMRTFLWLFGFFVLVYTGIESLISARHLNKTRSDSGDTLWKTFLSGFLMSLSNPMTILFWLGIYGSVLAETAARYDLHELAAVSLAMIAGLAIWDFLMAGVASFFRMWLTNRVLRIISILSGLSLIGFGAYFGLEAFRLLFG